MTPEAGEQSRRGRRTRVVLAVLVLTIASVAGTGFYLNQAAIQRHSMPNPCGEGYQGQGLGWFVECKGFLLTEEGAVCSLSSGSCTMTVVNNGTSSQLEVVTTGCDVMLPIMTTGSGANRSTTVMSVEGINGGPAASGVPIGSQSGATCWFPTNKYISSDTVQGVTGCFTFAQVGNLTNATPLCWFSPGRWSLNMTPNPPLDCPVLLSNLEISFNSLNISVGYVTIKNANSYGVWVAGLNGTSTVGPLGIAVNGPYVGDWFAIPQNETIPAESTVTLSFPGISNAGQRVTYTLSFLPANETVTYTTPCSMTYGGTYPTTAGS